MSGKKKLSQHFRPEQVEEFRINDFPKTQTERRAFLFRHTGYPARELTQQEWYCLNYSINQGLDLGLATDGSDKTLHMLSLIDHSLSQVPRFVGVSYMPPMRADSTAGHSKQVMNVVQTVFETSGILKRPETEQLRRDALVGAWIHDMGETVFELMTASDMFLMSAEDRAATSHEKDALEHEIFEFCCQLSAHCVQQHCEPEFNRVIRELRHAALEAGKPFTGEEQRRDKIVAQMRAIKEGMAKARESMQIPTERFNETARLMEIYDRTEIAAPGNFLHPLVKSLESVEGQRYLQRNANVHEIDRLGQALAQDRGFEYPMNARLELSNDQELIQGLIRVERRLPMLFETADKSYEKELAKSTARFVYRSAARQFLPKDTDDVGVAPAIIDRKPELPRGNPHQIPLKELEEIRRQEMEYKQQQLNGQQPEEYNARYMTRERMGAIYRAAEEMVGKRFSPLRIDGVGNRTEFTCLASLDHAPQLPDLLIGEAKKIENQLSKRNHVVQIGERGGRAA